MFPLMQTFVNLCKSVHCYLPVLASLVWHCKHGLAMCSKSVCFFWVTHTSRNISGCLLVCMSVPHWSPDRSLPHLSVWLVEHVLKQLLQPCKEVFPALSTWQGCWLTNSCRDYLWALVTLGITWPFACSSSACQNWKQMLKFSKKRFWRS